MCDTLPELEQALKGYAAGFDAAVLWGDQAAWATRAAACIEKVAASLKGMSARRAADAGVWKGRSAAAELAKVTGRSVSAAAETLETAHRLESLPVAAAAARRGDLSEAQVSAIVSTAGAGPSVESRLVELAARSSLSELRDECARVKAAPLTPRPGGARSTPADSCARTPTARGRGTCTCGTTPRWGRRSWPPSSPSESGCPPRPAPRDARSPRRLHGRRPGPPSPHRRRGARQGKGRAHRASGPVHPPAGLPGGRRGL
jgi:hypothetical protein